MKAILLLLLALPAVALGQTQNTLFLIADDVGAESIACYGRTAAPPPTPNIDALAARGVKFTNVWSNPLCSPTRATVLTGRYSFRTGVGTALGPNQQGLRLTEWILPEVLRAASWESALFGKWHVGNAQGPSTPNLAGFPYFAGHLLASLPSYFNWQKTINGQTSTSTTYAPTDVVNEALAWINARQGPWLAIASFHVAHTPLHAPPSHLHTQNLGGLDPRTQPVPFFKAMVEAMDTEIGRLLAGIPGPVLARTNVVFLGDNGTDRAVIPPPYPQNHAKGTLYQGGIMVPLIVAGPRVVGPGRDAGALVSTCDLFHTIGEFAGLDVRQVVPAAVPLDGRSILPYLASPTQPPLRETVYAEQFGFTAGTNGWTIRNATHKVIRFTDNPRDELYDLAADPHEQRNLLLLPLSAADRRHYVTLGAAAAALRGERYFGTFSKGCPGTRGIASIRAPSGGPAPGQPHPVVYENLPLGTPPVYGIVGFSNRRWLSLDLPLDLGAIGMPGCTLDSSVDVALALSASAGSARLTLSVPMSVELLGLSLFQQALVGDQGANAAGWITSDAGQGVIGRL
jgi:arylsulfatase A-like enzyme